MTFRRSSTTTPTIPPRTSPRTMRTPRCPTRQQGTTTDFRTVYLQRLANPLLPYDAQTQSVHHRGPDADRPVGVQRRGRQRGSRSRRSGRSEGQPERRPSFTSRERIGEDDYNIWRQVFSQTGKAANKDRSTHEFAHSLGFVSGFANGGNREQPVAGHRGRCGPAAQCRLTISRPAASTSAIPRASPFPWFTWNDHPFASHLELMNVPASSPSRLLYEHRCGPT